MLRDKLRGVVGFPITPFKTDLTLDLDALESNVVEMIKHPFCSLVAVGGTGEIYSLTPGENVEVVRRTVAVTNGKMPVIGGVGFNARIASEMAREMEKAGADALLVMPPYYTGAPIDGLLSYYEAIGKASGLPLSLYSRDWAVFSPDMVARLADRVPTLQIWKDGQGDMRKYQRIMAKVGDRLAWIGGIGDDCAAGYFAIGVQGYTSSISNVAPKLSLAIGAAGMERDFATLNSLLNKYVHPLYALRDRKRGYEVSVMKTFMDLIGLKGGPVRPPLENVNAAEVDMIKGIVELYKDYL
ncbi:MAG: dihydrodipicolinate synthase family protein [Bryobacterales bacterium]|nr:dihydrodipicolinate synthase family protein [Bryobacterales bacterium]MCZ2146846.1 dihydrodipicolinate synthase family protein [Bryobacterales bacterium]